MAAFGDVNRFYGNGLNKLEPKDVEQMACPDLRLLKIEDLKNLTKKIEAAMASLEISTAWFDKVLAHYLPTSVHA